ncbi:hypothetical protein HMPREF9148_00348 [Prevotella sp. F0091]|nr:hypothetical protein HMPREF9148_00348 [Prevotella sp. F0091]
MLTPNTNGAEYEYSDYLSPLDKKGKTRKRDTQPVYPFVILCIIHSNSNESNCVYLIDG